MSAPSFPVSHLDGSSCGLGVVGGPTKMLFEYGAYCPTPEPLTGELLDFVSDPQSKGTILVAFGTVINWARVPRKKFDAILDTLNSLTDYRIVWAYNGLPVNTKPHIFSSKWIPQVDVLFDNRTVLFFSHGGLKSVKEATCSSTPAVFMPMFAEQVRNGWMAKDKGFAKVFSKHDLTAENLRKTMKLVLENKSFSKNAARIATLFNDKVVHPLVQGAHHMNRLLRQRKSPMVSKEKSVEIQYIGSEPTLIYIPV
ncbi:hypothetical protein Y032_0560g3462 [Ancylostoma ceylanicum]|uniref:glucuronosyltransferase n=1 Tax=Ancylostoma ceylanicum TaxID=53326 RepID=A0A016WPS1_9BILA|nr:hypothetical protein Y032_0560g3462 [Ancylostoma ceylanicum]